MCEFAIIDDPDGETLTFALDPGCPERRTALADWLAFHGVTDPLGDGGVIRRDVSGRWVQLNLAERSQGETEPQPFPPFIYAEARRLVGPPGWWHADE